MSFEDVEYSFARLARIYERLSQESFEFSVTLDNEPANHPQAISVLHLTERYLTPFYYHHGSTTGIPFIRRADRDDLLRFLKMAGWDEVSFAIHGAKENHNVIVQRPGALQSLKKASTLFSEHQFTICVSLMLSKALIEDQLEVEKLLAEIDPDFTMMVIPLHAPNTRMVEYLKWRPTLHEALGILPKAKKWGCDVKRISDQLQQFHLHQVIQQVKEISFEVFDWPKSQDVAYYSLQPNLDLYYGNTGYEIRRVGNIRALSDDVIVELIKSSPANDSFFDYRLSHDERKYLYKRIREETLEYPDWIFPDLDSALCCLADLIL